MPSCPNCHWEYVDGTENCSDCGAELVDELEIEKFPDDLETAECYIAEDEIEAEIVKGILHQNHIPCIMTSQYSHIVHPFSHIGASGEVGILVPTLMQEEALLIIKEYKAQQGLLDDDFSAKSEEVEDEVFGEDPDADEDEFEDEFDDDYKDDYDDDEKDDEDDDFDNNNYKDDDDDKY